MKTITYLGPSLAEDGELDAEVTHRGQNRVEELKESVWSVVRQENDREDQGKVYRTVVRPALMYGAETWVWKKTQEKKLEVAEMRMLRRMCVVTKLDKIRNERIRGTTKVGEITKKVQERRLEWYGHVMRREEHYVGRRAMAMKVQGRRKRGRPKRRWLDKVKDAVTEKGLSSDDVYNRATYRRGKGTALLSHLAILKGDGQHRTTKIPVSWFTLGSKPPSQLVGAGPVTRHNELKLTTKSPKKPQWKAFVCGLPTLEPEHGP